MRKTRMPKIAIIMGSASDLDTMKEAVDCIKRFGVSASVKVLSAHRTPKEVAHFAESAAGQGVKVIIAGAGGAAALAGVVAAHTILPVIGVPMDTAAFKGIDSFLSTLQMPGGIPVACMSIGKSGARNAGLLAVEIVALSDKALQKKLLRYKKELAAAVLKQKITLS
jgi:phosphoribosylaminoimidazole carboxylase PurE protein